MKHKRHTSRLDKNHSLISAFNNAAAYVPIIMLPFGLLVRSHYLNSNFYAGDQTFLAIITTYALVSITYFYLLKRLPAKSMPYTPFLIGFHILTLLYVLFVSGFLSGFLAVWVVLMTSTHIYRGMRGFVLSFASLIATGLLSFLVHPSMSTGERIEVLQGAIVVGAIGYIIIRIHNTTQRERDNLAKIQEQENFQRERLLALVNSMGDAVVTTDESGKIRVYNAALLGLLDTNANLNGKNLDTVLKLRDLKKRKVSLMQEAQSTRKVFSRTDLIHSFGEDSIRLYINVAPISPSYQSKAERGYIFIIRDITKEKTLEEERDEFISVVSHELRTPIAIAEGNLSNIRLLQERGAKPDVIQHAIDDAHSQILYLAKIINDLSTLSRAERSIAKEGTEEIDVKQTLTDLYQSYLPQAKKQGLRLDLDVSGQLPTVRTNRMYLAEILQNFLTNAFKYTHKGSVTIIGHNTKEGVHIAIKDTGIGISKSDQRHMFEKFYRSEDYRTRESSGTGLGLYINKKLADKVGLPLSFESRLNHGSTFSVTIKPPNKSTDE